MLDALTKQKDHRSPRATQQPDSAVDVRLPAPRRKVARVELFKAEAGPLVVKELDNFLSSDTEHGHEHRLNMACAMLALEQRFFASEGRKADLTSAQRLTALEGEYSRRVLKNELAFGTAVLTRLEKWLKEVPKQPLTLLFDLDCTLGTGSRCGPWLVRPVAKPLVEYIKANYPQVEVGVLSGRTLSRIRSWLKEPHALQDLAPFFESKYIFSTGAGLLQNAEGVVCSWVEERCRRTALSAVYGKPRPGPLGIIKLSALMALNRVLPRCNFRLIDDCEEPTDKRLRPIPNVSHLLHVPMRLRPYSVSN